MMNSISRLENWYEIQILTYTVWPKIIKHAQILTRSIDCRFRAFCLIQDVNTSWLCFIIINCLFLYTDLMPREASIICTVHWDVGCSLNENNVFVGNIHEQSYNCPLITIVRNIFGKKQSRLDFNPNISNSAATQAASSINHWVIIHSCFNRTYYDVLARNLVDVAYNPQLHWLYRSGWWQNVCNQIDKQNFS